MWRYTLRDLHPGGDPEAWARELADTVINGRAVRRYSLRKWTGAGEPPEAPSLSPS